MANFTIAMEFIISQGGEHLRKFSKGVSIGIRLLDAVVDELFRHDDPAAIFTYRTLYDSVNSRLDQIALLLAKRVQDQGYQAYPIPASQRNAFNKLIGTISHKLAASLSDLGWIGKSCLLITPKYGPRVRFGTILTNTSPDSGRTNRYDLW